MLREADLISSWRARPRGFVALMGLYESNYLRFVHLAGAPALLRGVLISKVAGDCELQLSVIEHMRYTSLLCLSYLLPAPGRSAERLPDLHLRAYHDARLLEAERLSGAANADPVAGSLPPAGERELHHRWARNMMLNKWLEYCMERGHRFV